MASQVKAKVSLDQLYECFREVTKKRGLVEFIQDVRGPENDMSGKESIKQADLANLFSSKIWKEQDKGGHRKLTSEITGIVVEYANHAKKIDPGAVETLVEQLQQHVNILHNGIFDLTKRGWPQRADELDFKAALLRANQTAKKTSEFKEEKKEV